MDLLGTIEPPAAATSGRAEWITLIGAHPALAPVQPVQGINPFTKEPYLYKPRPDSARVLLEGSQVGSISWAEDGSQLLVVWSNVGVQARVAKVAADVASRLGWSFLPASAA